MKATLFFVLVFFVLESVFSQTDQIIDKDQATLFLGSGGDGGPHGIVFDDESGSPYLQLVYRTNPNQLLIEKVIDQSPLFSVDFDTEVSYFKGRVGIGTTDPSSSLQVNGEFNVDEKVSIKTGQSIPTTNGVEKVYNKYGQESLSENVAFTMFGNDDTDRFSFMVDYDNSGTFTERLVIKANNGNVGIGTTSPTDKLEVYGNFAGNGITVSSTTGAGIVLNRASSSFNSNVRFATAGEIFANFGADNDGTNNLYISGDGSFNNKYVTFQEGGNVGIGTTSPNSKLEVNGDFNVGGQAIIEADLNIETTNGTPKIYSRFGQLNLKKNIAFTMYGDDNTDRFSFMTDYGNSGTYSERLVIMAQSGNVGIGVVSPDSKLVVDGRVKSEEVKVEIIAGSAPDYVFSADYDLRTLDETRKYIEENKHLPEIPSANEMETHGIDLGVMNMRLLKKVEELTLYQLELLDRIRNAEEEIKELKKSH